MNFTATPNVFDMIKKTKVHARKTSYIVIVNCLVVFMNLKVKLFQIREQESQTSFIFKLQGCF